MARGLLPVREIDPLSKGSPIVNPKDGIPTEYFHRMWLSARQINLTTGDLTISVELLQTLIAELQALAAELGVAVDAVEEDILAVREFRTDFPGSPVTGKIVYRTDRNIEYVYDGTRWLSTQPFHLSMGPGDVAQFATTDNQARLRCYAPTHSYSIYLLRADVSVYVATTNSGTQFWDFNLKSEGTGGATLGTTSTISLAADTFHRLTSITVNAVIGSGIVAFQLEGDKTLTPGGPAVNCNLEYRLIG